jgi:transcriptional regulator with XRE-family HTH domain
VTTTPKRKVVQKKQAARRKLRRDETPVYFGKQVKAAREAGGLTQRDLARLVGIHQPDVTSVERGRDVRLSTASRIARALNVSLHDLLPPDC